MIQDALIENKKYFRKVRVQKNVIKISFLCIFSILLLVASINAGLAEERYRGTLIVDKDNGKYEIDDKYYVELVIDKESLESINIHSKAGNKDLNLMFNDCGKVKDNGSTFTKLFSIECRTMIIYEGGSYVEMAKTYALISPKITPQYSIYKKLKKISGGLGLNIPSRMFVIYANDEILYEFFCYPENIEE